MKGPAGWPDLTPYPPPPFHSLPLREKRWERKGERAFRSPFPPFPPLLLRVSGADGSGRERKGAEGGRPEKHENTGKARERHEMDHEDREKKPHEGRPPCGNPEKWLVLRCGGSYTTSLEEELTEAGFRAWTPQSWFRRRLPRRRTRVWERHAVLPSYVFLAEEDYEAVEGLRKVEWVLGFKLMLIQGEIVTIPDGQLEGLREYDRRDRPQPRQPKPPMQPKRPELKKGDRVVLLGLLGGEKATVEAVDADGEVRVVLEKTSLKVAISGFLVEPI